MLSQHLQTSCDLLVRECCCLISQMPSFKSLLFKAVMFASDLDLIDTLHFTSGQLKNAICSSQWQKLNTIIAFALNSLIKSPKILFILVFVLQFYQCAIMTGLCKLVTFLFVYFYDLIILRSIR